MENFYDMSRFNKKSVESNVRIQNQTAEFLKEHSDALKEELENKEQKKLDAAMSGARFGHNSSYTRSKNRTNALTEEIRYNENSSVIGMAEVISTIVEESLLMDKEELNKIYPEYRNDIKNIVTGFLKEGNINQNINKKETLTLMESVARNLPDVKDGKYLTEDELSNLIKTGISNNLEVNRTIKGLSGDISNRVATLMEKEEEGTKQLQKEQLKATTKKEEKSESGNTEEEIQEVVEALENGELTPEDIEEMLNDGDITRDEYDEIMSTVSEDSGEDEQLDQQVDAENGEADESQQIAQEDEETPEGEEDQYTMEDSQGQMPEDTNVNIDQTQSTTPKKQIQMLPDGTMNINIYENFNLVKEVPRQGLFESLAVNEAMNMIKEGKEYNPEYCLAKAVLYVTITEAMSELNLMNIGKKEYSQIIESAGGNTKYTPDLSDESKQTIHNLIKDKEQHPEKYSKKYASEEERKKFQAREIDPKNENFFEEEWRVWRNAKDTARAIGSSIGPGKGGIPIMKAKLDLAHHMRKQQDTIEDANKKIAKEKSHGEGLEAYRDSLKPKAEEKTTPSETVTESILVSQYTPNYNNKPMNHDSSDSLAERIRQKRLLAEQQNKMLNE